VTSTKGFLGYAITLLGALFLAFLALQLLPSVDVQREFQVSSALLDKNHILLQLLCALSFILIVTRIFGGLAKKIGEPAVIGEVLGGIVIGPSLLGWVFPAVSAFFFPPEVLPHISVIAQLGIIFYMFVVGLEFDLSVLKNNAHSTLLISHVSIIFPLLLGFVLGAFTYTDFAPAGVQPLHFALFVGISLSITAFPVLARILTDKGLDKSPLGKMALACAAIDDVTAWCLLAVCLSLMQEKLSQGLLTLGLTVGYILFMLKILRPLLIKWVQKLEVKGELSTNALAFFFVALFLSALVTEAIGIHAIFGAFLLGVVLPHNSRVKKELTHYTENLSKVVFLPAFFVFTGLRTEIALINSPQDWFWCAIIIFIATLGKFGGATLAAKYSGYSFRDSAAIGILMNTRGLVELVVLNIGLDLGVLSPRLFTMLVMMALVTTFLTSPMLNLILSSGSKKLSA